MVICYRGPQALTHCPACVRFQLQPGGVCGPHARGQGWLGLERTGMPPAQSYPPVCMMSVPAWAWEDGSRGASTHWGHSKDFRVQV